MIRNKADSKLFEMLSLQSTDTGSLSVKVESEDEMLENESMLTERLPVQLESLCRMCAQPLSSVATSSPTPTLTYQLLHYFGIMIKEGDGLPTGICDECDGRLNYMEQLKKDVTEIQKFLREQLDNNQESFNNELSTDKSNDEIDNIIATHCTVLSQSGSEMLKDIEACTAFSNEDDDVCPEPLNNNDDSSSNQSYDTSRNDPDYDPSNEVQQNEITVNTTPSFEDNYDNKNLNDNDVSKTNSQSEDNLNPKSIIKPSQSVPTLKKYICKICKKKYDSLETFKIHFKTSHTNFNNSLKHSKNTKPNKKSTKIRNNVDNYKVDDVTGELIKIASKTDKPETHREQLLNKWGDIEFFICTICNIKYKTSLELSDHYIETHMEEKNFDCKMCSKTFKLKKYLLRHLKKQTVGHAKYFCPVCDRTCITPAALRNHLNVHSSEKNFQCSQCGKRYRTHSTLYSHIKQVHDNVKRFMCESCSKMFHTKTLLKRHILTFHTKVRPFVCNVCNKGFIRLMLLKRHEYIHTDDRPFRCIKCDRGFVCKQKWTQHMRIICHIPDKDICSSYGNYNQS